VRGSLLDHLRRGSRGHERLRLTKVERCADQPKSMSHGTVEVFLPSRYGLETVEKGSIILKMSEALDGGSDIVTYAECKNTKVQGQDVERHASKSGILPPFLVSIVYDVNLDRRQSEKTYFANWSMSQLQEP